MAVMSAGSSNDGVHEMASEASAFCKRQRCSGYVHSQQVHSSVSTAQSVLASCSGLLSLSNVGEVWVGKPFTISQTATGILEHKRGMRGTVIKVHNPSTPAGFVQIRLVDGYTIGVPKRLLDSCQAHARHFCCWGSCVRELR